MLRGVAAFLVVVVHAINVSDWRFAQGLDSEAAWMATALSFNEFGASGVDLFFVISGFVMAMMLAADPHRRIGDFVMDRLIRIVPLFWLASAIYAALLMLMARDIAPAALMATITVIPLDPALYVAPLLFVGWSLGFELIFYAVVGASLSSSPRHRSAIIITTLILMIGVGALSPPAPGVISLLFNAIFAEFLLGIGCFAIWYRYAGQASPIMARTLAGSGAALLLLSAVFGVDFDAQYMAIIDGGASAQRALVWGVPWAMVMAGLLLDCRRDVHLATDTLLHRIGDASFALYLVHVMVSLIAETWIPAIGIAPDVIVAGTILVSLVCGLAAHRWVEGPMLIALKRLRRRATPHHAATA